MLKKSFVLAVVCIILLLTMAGPAVAVLKVLEPELSEELREIAKAYLVQEENISGDAITIEDGWVREYRNVGVDVYMVAAVVDKGLATERKVQLPVRVDQKVVLSDADLAALEEEDNALAPEEPVFRVTGDPVAEEVSPGAGNTNYYIAAAVLAALILGTTLITRRRAIKHK